MVLERNILLGEGVEELTEPGKLRQLTCSRYCEPLEARGWEPGEVNTVAQLLARVSAGRHIWRKRFAVKAKYKKRTVD